jgi:UDP-2,3-diacylglucosamine pyrophosphatase LpxH
MDPNILVISDLHLGEDVKPHHVSYLRQVAQLERQLEAFLAHHTRVRINGAPWRLIVNGDMVDFLGVLVLPDDSESSEHVSPEERRFGLGTGPRAARRKLLRVVDRHPGVFRELASFVGAGNELVIVLGNHDVEFHWEPVQEAFRSRIAAFWAVESGTSEADARALLDGRIGFHPWFYYQQDLVYVEHGHQYDEWCSFEHWLNPVAPKESDGILLNFAAACIRFMSNMIPDTKPHSQDAWNGWEYLKWIWGLGWRGALRAAYYYAYCIWRLADLSRSLRAVAGSVDRKTLHLGRLRELAARYRLPEETLTQINALQRAPATLSLTKVLRTLFVDRLVLVLLVALVTGAAIFGLPSSEWKLAGAVAAMVLGVATNELLARARKLNTAEMLGGIPAAIRRHLSARYIVFGHSHDPQAVELGGGAWYFNTGTWMPSEEQRGACTAFTHLLIAQGEDGPRAELRQWRDGVSAVYDAGACGVAASPRLGDEK